MKNLLTRWFANRPRRGRKVRGAARPRRRTMSVEALEDRLVLSTYLVTSLADANPPAGTTTLRQAITAANNDHNTDPNNPDLITINLTGTLALQSALPALTGSVAISGPGPSGLTVQGDGKQDFILTLAASAAATVSGLTLDGKLQNGGIFVSQGATLTVQDAAIQNGVDPGGSGAGGIFNNGGTVNLTRARLLNNFGDSGGALDNKGGTLTVSQSTFSGNIALGSGGGAIDTTDGGVLLVLNSTFANNSTPGAQGGGALELVASTATVAESTFVGNSATVFGGAILVNFASRLTLSGSTLTGNSVTAGGGGTAGGLSVRVGGSTAVLRDTIVAGNFIMAGNGTKTLNDVVGTLDPNSAFNLIGDGTGLTLPNGNNPVPIDDNFNDNQVGTDSHPIDPRLGPLQDNGGPTFTVAPLPGSPALDRGAPDPTADLLSPTDQRGKTRVVPQSFLATPAGGDGRDLGAFELEAQTTPTTLVVNSTADANPPAGVLTLRQALAAANGTVPLASLPAGQVTPGSPYFTAIQFSVTGSIALASPLPTITQNAMLEGSGASSLALTGDGVIGEPILLVASGASATVAGLTLDGHQRNRGITVGPHGSLIVQNSVLENCLGGGSGGAIRDVAAAVAVRATQLLNNEGDSGGGIGNVGGSLSVFQSTFAGNLGLSSGGGITNETDANGSGGSLTLQDSTFATNSSQSNGGALYLASHFPDVTVKPYQGSGVHATVGNSTFVGNFAVVVGGALFASSTLSLTVTNSTLTQNLAGVSSALDSNGGASVRLVDTIVAGNVVADSKGKPTTVASDVAGVPLDPTSAYNLIGTGGSGGLRNTNGNQVGVANPGLGTLGDNGGPTQTVPLLPGSPAIDAGDPNFAPPPDFDQRGVGFPRVVNGRVDIGAFEVQTPPPVADAGGPYNINEGDTLTLNAGGSSDPNGYTLTYSWTINGVANAAAGIAPVLTYAQLQALGIDDGPGSFAVSVTVNDGHGQAVTASTTLTVQDVAVTVGAGGDTLLAQGGTLGRAGSFTDPAFDGPFTATVDYGDGGGAQALALGANETFSLSHPYAQAGTFTVTVAVTDKDGTRGQAAFQVTVVAPPAVAAFVVNDGNVQRSKVNSLTVTFTTAVTLDAGAFDVTRSSGGSAGLVITASADQKTFVLTFTGAGIIGGSLPDGRYTLTAHHDRVHETSGLKLALTADATSQFFRLFGDANGDGKVDNYDLAFLRSTYGKHRGDAGYLWWLDYYQDGTVANDDVLQFVRRYGKRI